MSDWIEQYSAALAERDAREQAHAPYFEAYTRLADRTSNLVLPAAILKPSSSALESSPQTSTGRLAHPNPANDTATLNNELSSLRLDLQSTQKARTTLQTALTNTAQTLSSLQAQHAQVLAQQGSQAKIRLDLERKLRDRDEELRLKSKVAEQAQDEMVALELQLSIAERERSKAEEENRTLIDRWMESKREEAEQVNRDSKWV